MDLRSLAKNVTEFATETLSIEQLSWSFRSLHLLHRQFGRTFQHRGVVAKSVWSKLLAGNTIMVSICLVLEWMTSLLTNPGWNKTSHVSALWQSYRGLFWITIFRAMLSFNIFLAGNMIIPLAAKRLLKPSPKREWFTLQLSYQRRFEGSPITWLITKCTIGPGWTAKHNQHLIYHERCLDFGSERETNWLYTSKMSI